MRSDVPKQHLALAGGTVLGHTMTALASSGLLAGIVLVHAEDDPWLDNLDLSLSVPVHRAVGGVRRADSVVAGLRALHAMGLADAWVMVHDAARPCVSASSLRRLLEAVQLKGHGAILATPVTDTLKQSGDRGSVLRSVDRSSLWRAQTPQLFPGSTLLSALEGALAAGVEVTDESSAMEWAGEPVALVEGDPANIKITLPGDLAIAEAYLGQPERQAMESDSATARPGAGSMRIGHGYDVHRFGAGDHIVLGGVRIAHTAALEAHSDGDVLIHALCDALLGAVAAGDIGRHFPDTDSANADIDSRILLRRVHALLAEQGWRLANADITLVAQSPKIAPHVDAMRSNLAEDLEAASAVINVKATTTEKLGFTGREEGIAVHAVVCLERAPE